jgi:hypothetical protein
MVGLRNLMRERLSALILSARADELALLLAPNADRRLQMAAQRENADPAQLLTALTTEHFTLQGARSQTISESSARASVYVFSVSSALVALGFVAQTTEVGDAFNVFALAVLPTLYMLGAVTFVRMVECGAEDFRYGMAINRIRTYYKEVAGDRANLFLLSGHDDGRGVFANMSLMVEKRTPLFAFSSAIAVIKGLVGGSAIGIGFGALA